MSALSRVSACPTTHEVAEFVATRLSDLGSTAPAALPTGRPVAAPDGDSPAPPHNPPAVASGSTKQVPSQDNSTSSTPTSTPRTPDTSGLGTTARRPRGPSHTWRNTASAPVPNTASRSTEVTLPQDNSWQPDPPTVARAFGPVGLGTGALLQPPGVTEPPQVPTPSTIVSSTGSATPSVTSTPNLVGLQLPPIHPDTRAALSDLLASGLSGPPWIGAPSTPAEAEPPTGPTGLGTDPARTRDDHPAALPPAAESPELRRFLGGSPAWHAGSKRYSDAK